MSVGHSILSGLAKGVGATAGFFTGGPVGAAAGYKLGGSAVDNPRGIPIVGPIAESTGLIGKSPEEEGLQHAFDEAQRQSALNRPMSEAAHQASIEQQLALFGPINEMLKQMYGPQFQLDLSAFSKSPLAMAREAPTASGLYDRSHDSTLPPIDQNAWTQGYSEGVNDPNYSRGPGANGKNDLGVGPQRRV